jgi:predicted MFS family arabinose efflux permease
MITGICTMIASPFIGKLSDAWGKYTIFLISSLLLIVIVIFFCSLGITPLWIVIGFSVVMFINVSGRIISATALFSAVPAPNDRGAFMSINSSVQMVSGGVASLIAGMIVYQDASGKMINYPILGYVVSGATLITIVMMYFINRMVTSKKTTEPKPVVA